MKTDELREALEFMDKNEIIKFLSIEFKINGNVFKHMNLETLKKYSLKKNKEFNDNNDKVDEVNEIDNDEVDEVDEVDKTKKVVKKELLNKMFSDYDKMRCLNVNSIDFDEYFFSIYQGSIKYEKRQWFIWGENGWEKSSVKDIADILISNIQKIYFSVNTFENISKMEKFESNQKYIYDMEKKKYKDKLTVLLKNRFTV